MQYAVTCIYIHDNFVENFEFIPAESCVMRALRVDNGQVERALFHQ